MPSGSKTLSKEEKKRRKQERARARRHNYTNVKVQNAWVKPLEEWDLEELARGRPRDANGQFRGKSPSVISRQVHEEAIRQFTDLTQADMRGIVPQALDAIRWLVTCDDEDEKGKRLVPPSVKLQASSWVVEHLVGKPTQRIEADVSVRLQGILAQVMVNPDGKPAIDLPSWELEAADDLEEDASEEG